jgi:RHS repeat-associated protein
MDKLSRILLIAILASAVIAGTVAAAAPGQRYIVILKNRTGAAPDVASLGGSIEFRQDDEVVVTIPPGAIAALKADPKVRYVERVGGEPLPAEDVLIGAPSDPQPGHAPQARHFTPHALGSTQWDSGTYKYDGAGNIIGIGTDYYVYDGVQRLTQSSTKGTAETYTYDGFGNMKTRTNQTIPQVQASTNQYLGYTYNEIGAVTSDGSYTFTYDALGQPLSKAYPNKETEYYLYTASDERIGVARGGWWDWSIRDESGKVLRQYKSSITNPSLPSLWVEDFVWRNGLLLGSQRPLEMGGRRHFHLDHLGTPRLVTSDDGQLVSYHDYYPFGDEHSPVAQEVPSGFDREDPLKFTGHERDYAGGMGGEDGHAVDYMHARYYNPNVGRFLSVDPVEGNPSHPQSWNRYAYVMNNPINGTDPTGKDCVNALNCIGQVLALTNPMTYIAGYNDAVMEAVLPSAPAANGSIQPTYAEFTMIAPFVPGASAGAASETETVLQNATKGEALQAVRGGAGEMTDAQRAIVIRQVQRATTKESVTVVRESNGTVSVMRTRPGHDGAQTMVRTIPSAGEGKTVQTATNAAGKTTHYDPKSSPSLWDKIKSWWY